MGSAAQPGDGRVFGGGVRVVPMHVVRALRVQRIGDGDGPLGRSNRDLEPRIRRLEPVGHFARVIHLPGVEEGIDLLQRRGHHQFVRRHADRERATFGDEGQHRAREALLEVLEQQRRRRPVHHQAARVRLIGKVGLGHLGLLEGELEEPLHFSGVLRQLHPAADEAFERRRIRRHRGHFGVRRGQPHQQVLHLTDVDEGRDRLGRRRGGTSVRRRSRLRRLA